LFHHSLNSKSASAAHRLPPSEAPERAYRKRKTNVSSESIKTIDKMIGS
jgi:hypothetical protein